MKAIFQIRNLDESDFESIANLSNQLGYKTKMELIRAQIATISNHPEHFAFVALKGKSIVGYIHCCRSIRLTTSPFIEICGLVIDKNERRKGIGKVLVEHAQLFAGKEEKIRVRCNLKRKEAHLFYENLGFILKKEQKIFDLKIL